MKERALTPELTMVDVQDGLVWHRDGRVTLLYRLEAHHEPAMSDAEFDAASCLAEDVWSAGLPEGGDFQFYVVVDAGRAAKSLEEQLPGIDAVDERAVVLEEFRRVRLAELARVDRTSSRVSCIQERRHYLGATFAPKALRRSWKSRLWGLVARRQEDWEAIYKGTLDEADQFHRAVEYALRQMGLRYERCSTSALVGFLHELLSPTTAAIAPLERLSALGREERGEFPQAAVKRWPWVGDSSPVWSLAEDDLVVRRDHLELGDRCVGAVVLKALPDKTEPGLLVPLLHLGRTRYVVVYRVEIPESGLEMRALRAKATLASGLRLQNFLVESDRKDAMASAVEQQSDTAMSTIIASTQRILAVTLQVLLYEESPKGVEEGCQEVISVMSRAHGLRGHRERYLLKQAVLSALPGGRQFTERRRRALTPVAVDMLPVFGFQSGRGKIPFSTPTNSLVWYDPFDTTAVANGNILVTGTSGAGKSFLVSILLSGYDLAAASRGEPAPYTFILDNGASYERYAKIVGGRYVPFSFDEAPGVDIFAWDEEVGSLDEHVSRLEWLLLDLLRVNERDEERFERVKAVIEEALKEHIYLGTLAKSFAGFEEALRLVGGAEAEGLVKALYPYTQGKFARLFTPNPRLAMSEGVHCLCYDFKGLAEHRDFASLALRLTIYQVRQWAARVSRKGHRTFLVLDESWALLDAGGGGGEVAATAAPFIAASVRMGRKEGMGVIGLSQELADYLQSAYGAAIVGNSATKFIGQPDRGGVEVLREHLRLTDRQVEQVRSLKRTARFHEFLLLRGDRSDVVRVPGDALSRWVFTTSSGDRERIAALAASRPDLSLLEQMRVLVAEAG